MSAVLALADNLALDRNHLPVLQKHFYASSVRDLLPLVGSHEHSAYDFHSAMAELNRSLCLDLDATDQRAFAFLLTGLSQASRFGGDPHVNPGLGENSAVHSCHCALLIADVFRRARLVGPDRENEYVARLRLSMTLGALIHDMGEMLGEITSLPMRAADSNLSELPKVERKIFEASLRLAYWAAQEDQPTEFYGLIRNLRVKAKIGGPDFVGIAALEKIIDNFNRDQVTRYRLSDENAHKVEELLRHFDMVELHDAKGLTDDERFCGYAVKVVEHVQGTRYFVRICEKDDTYKPLSVFRTPTFPNLSRGEEQPGCDYHCVPSSFMVGVRVIKSMKYTQEGLGELRENAKTPQSLALARQLRDAAYETTIEWLNAVSPYVDLEEEKSPLDLKELARRLRDGNIGADDRRAFYDESMVKLRQYQEELQLRHRSDLEASGTMNKIALLPVESRERLMSLYWSAIGMDYFPQPGKILALLPEIPAKLAPLHELDWNAIREHGIYI
jgi:hypothetical protein